MHFTTKRFWKCYESLPSTIQQLSDQNYELLKADSSHPSLHFKKVGKYWSVRVGKNYRAVGLEAEKGIVWFWIGTHAEYDKIIR